MALRRTTKVSAEPSMSSMSDLIFLLLIFFLITSTLVNPNALKLLLPKSTNQVSESPTVSVSIKDWHDGSTYTYHINGSETPVPEEAVEGEEDPTFSIYADESVPVGKIVGMMNIAKRNHYKVILATSPE